MEMKTIQSYVSLYFKLTSETEDGLKVGLSRIPGGGFGLYTTRKIESGDIICLYTGREYSLKDSFRLQDRSYLMRLPEGKKMVDGREEYQMKGRYINDCRNQFGYNVEFVKRRDCAEIVSLREIFRGEELFVNYGRWYWINPSTAPSSISLPSLLSHQLQCKELEEGRGGLEGGREKDEEEED